MKPRYVLTLILLALLTPPLPLQAADNPPVTVRVARGDNLIRICRTYLEDPRQWPEIAKFNHIRTPHRIHPGDIVRIPVAYLKGVPVAGRVTALQGEVLLRPNGGGDWQPLAVGAPLSQGDRIRTGQDGGVEIAFPDQVILQVRARTDLEVTAARRKSAAYLIYRLRMASGRILSRVRRLTGRERRMIIQTPSAVASIRGTSFRLGVDEGATTRCGVLDGHVGVAAGRSVVEVPAGQGTFVQKGRPPAPPRPLLPPPRLTVPEPLYRRLPIALAVSADPGSASLHLAISTSPDFRTIHRELHLSPGQPITLSNLEDGRYYLQASAADSEGLLGLPSATATLVLRTHPRPPFIQAPAEGVRIFQDRPVLVWLTVGDAARYQLEVARHLDFQDIVHRLETTATRIQLPSTAPGEYVFRIRSLAADGFAGPWSDGQRFNIAPPPPAPPLQPPTADAEKLHLRWQQSPEAAAYRLQLATDEGFENIVIDRRIEVPAVELARPKSSGTYFVRAAAIDAHGRQGDFSQPQHFVVEPSYGPAAATGIIMLVLALIIVL